ncbi:unnamed protein product [Amoebophrya sp. A120]|nr:unnamed protein product [Amoebophrya sp. A120]|eukprot:GSA120T00000667001.1
MSSSLRTPWLGGPGPLRLLLLWHVLTLSCSTTLFASATQCSTGLGVRLHWLSGDSCETQLLGKERSTASPRSADARRGGKENSRPPTDHEVLPRAPIDDFELDLLLDSVEFQIGHSDVRLVPILQPNTREPFLPSCLAAGEDKVAASSTCSITSSPDHVPSARAVDGCDEDPCQERGGERSRKNPPKGAASLPAFTVVLLANPELPEDFRSLGAWAAWIQQLRKKPLNPTALDTLLELSNQQCSICRGRTSYLQCACCSSCFGTTLVPQLEIASRAIEESGGNYKHSPCSTSSMIWPCLPCFDGRKRKSVSMSNLPEVRPEFTPREEEAHQAGSSEATSGATREGADITASVEARSLEPQPSSQVEAETAPSSQATATRPPRSRNALSAFLTPSPSRTRRRASTGVAHQQHLQPVVFKDLFSTPSASTLGYFRIAPFWTQLVDRLAAEVLLGNKDEIQISELHSEEDAVVSSFFLSSITIEGRIISPGFWRRGPPSRAARHVEGAGVDAKNDFQGHSHSAANAAGTTPRARTFTFSTSDGDATTSAANRGLKQQEQRLWSSFPNRRDWVATHTLSERVDLIAEDERRNNPDPRARGGLLQRRALPRNAGNHEGYPLGEEQRDDDHRRTRLKNLAAHISEAVNRQHQKHDPRVSIDPRALFTVRRDNQYAFGNSFADRERSEGTWTLLFQPEINLERENTTGRSAARSGFVWGRSGNVRTNEAEVEDEVGAHAEPAQQGHTRTKHDTITNASYFDSLSELEIRLTLSNEHEFRDAERTTVGLTITKYFPPETTKDTVHEQVRQVFLVHPTGRNSVLDENVEVKQLQHRPEDDIAEEIDMDDDAEIGDRDALNIRNAFQNMHLF